ncbi:D-tagatose-bisphosphate aldolase, class II, non-catalytic subunit [Variovorax rhizosphaerae]|uniref:D-tagatose-bisphosphate aldolase, class II, non-catalytic subunit n=1 Tax=Variovorax rhizosphaerae TaxID=1836200 RepID=A0ABU8WEW4_9BURK
MTNPIANLASSRRSGNASGIYSVCSAHPLVIEAAMQQSLEDGTPLLIEATSNQVDQFGGYTGMRPSDFRKFVAGIAAKVAFPIERIILGGDHLGPNPWRDRPSEEAMRLAEDLMASYASAGFLKLHLDASMACGGDPERLDDAVVAQRAARLCRAAEAAADGAQIVYVIGTEVPVPGGATEALDHVEVTSASAARNTLEVHRKAFEDAGLRHVWPRVIAMVVQPGVEFDHTSVIDYVPSAATDLTRLLDDQTQIVFEAHSTDYQGEHALAALVRDGFAILKVGPGLSFALREALYALSEIEAALAAPERRAYLPEVVERVMLDKPANWARYYHGNASQQKLLRVYSYSDRIRYYWNDESIEAATRRLLENLADIELPENVISQYLPNQYIAIREGRLAAEPRALVLDRVRDALRPYAAACRT